VRAAKSDNPKLRGVVVIGDPLEDCHTFFEMIKTDTHGVRFVQGKHMNTLDHVALLPYSSGTTGRCKVQFMVYVVSSLYSNPR